MLNKYNKILIISLSLLLLLVSTHISLKTVISKSDDSFEFSSEEYYDTNEYNDKSSTPDKSENSESTDSKNQLVF